jgi:hypothetical protein
VKDQTPGADRTLRALRRAALRHPNIEEGLACKGTVIESATFEVQGKAFLFLRPEKAMLRLDRSHGEAATLAAKKPACYKVGSGGWITISLSSPNDLSMKVLSSWVAKRYSLFAAKRAPSSVKSKRV